MLKYHSVELGDHIFQQLRTKLGGKERYVQYKNPQSQLKILIIL